MYRYVGIVVKDLWAEFFVRVCLCVCKDWGEEIVDVRS